MVLLTGKDNSLILTNGKMTCYTVASVCVESCIFEMELIRLFRFNTYPKRVAADMQVNEGWNKGLRRRAVDILSSISAPPAMAEGSVKGKVDGLLSAAHSSSSIHVSARLIQIHDITVMGGAGQWTLQKNRGMRFVLSYDMPANDVVGKSVCFEPEPKMQGGGLMLLLRGGFYLFGLSVLILSASFKVGMCIYSK